MISTKYVDGFFDSICWVIAISKYGFNINHCMKSYQFTLKFMTSKDITALSVGFANNAFLNNKDDIKNDGHSGSNNNVILINRIGLIYSGYNQRAPRIPNFYFGNEINKKNTLITIEMNKIDKYLAVWKHGDLNDNKNHKLLVK